MEFHEIVTAQRDYFNTGATKKTETRKQTLHTLKKAIEENHELLCDSVYKDLRRNNLTTYNLEISNAIAEIDYMIENVDEWAAPHFVEKTFLTALDTPMIVKDPKGVVLIVSPWNYPVSMVLLPLINVIAAGNTAIIKPSEMAPHTADAFDLIFSKCFDKNTVAIIKGGIPETTSLLTERFDHIIYTGCPPVAKIIMAAAAKHLTPVTLELGGKCPVIIMDDADIETSAKRVAWGKWLNCGQTCLAPDYVLISAKLKDRFVDALRKTIADFYGSDICHSPDYSRIINQRHFDRLNGLLEKTNSPILFKGGDCEREDNFIPPVILDASRDDAFMQDEIFGPVLPILTSESLAESIAFINEGEKPLAAYIFTRSEKKLEQFYQETSSGAITVNDVIMHITVDTLPFGGVGNSGMGRYRGKYGFDTFTHEKAVLKRGFFGEALLAARYPPVNDSKFNQLKKLTSSRKGIPKVLKGCIPSLPLILIGIVLGMVLQLHDFSKPNFLKN
ncbi:hypothetical protein L596_000215 [Steinernema carpocapsae]|uniref:Aldehyde dehydrogenase n=1 Tax=Steinernema carpocapsae TaxID=34508 RepID=A0A4U8UJW9_STECR|nr:hypothetical protein L596_000215 [Steinernema carpocapsae]